MISRTRTRLLSASLLAAAACGEDPRLGVEPEVGAAIVSLNAVPLDATCLQINVTGTRSVERRFDLAAGQSVALSLSGLPLGLDTFEGFAYANACSAVTDDTIKTWSSEPVAARIVAGTLAAVTLRLRPHRGSATVTVDFEDDLDAAAGDAEPGLDAATPDASSSDAGAPDVSAPDASTCMDGLRNGDESDVDCGGRCRQCENNLACGSSSDCISNYCPSGRCAAYPTMVGDCAGVPDGVRCFRQNSCEYYACGGGTCSRAIHYLVYCYDTSLAPCSAGVCDRDQPRCVPRPQGTPCTTPAGQSGRCDGSSPFCAPSSFAP